jgi:hypothetical protein
MPLIRLFLDICLLNKGPQDSPASSLLLGLTVAANLAVGIALSLIEAAKAEALIQAAVGALLLGGFLWIALSFTGKRSRFLQTATAAFGADTLISIAALPLLVWGRWATDAQGLVAILLLLLMLWQMAVIGHILHHALSVSFPAGLGLALAYTATSYGIMMTFSPPLE